MNKKPELMAPAGNVESLYAALESGADAAYLGLDKFNARLRARNFTPRLLCAAIDFAHSRGKKIYVTLNTLIKETEIPEVTKLLSMLEAARPDALIVADYGIIAIVKKHFPGLVMHASTQAGAHNSQAVRFLAGLGIRRAILARELSIKEIAAIRGTTDMEIEVFVHGALCYSLSGYCLASSFLGGRSGNRGLCTQVCRRPFRKGNASGVFFSPLDLQALELVPDLVAAGVDAFKIEGRMKNAGYLTTVVKAYRRAIDHPQFIPDLKAELAFDLARPKTTFFMSGPGERILGGKYTRAAGLFLGTIAGASEGKITLRARLASGPGIDDGGPAAFSAPAPVVQAGDWIRILPASGFEGERVRVKSTRDTDAGIEISFSREPGAAEGRAAEIKIRPGDEIYLADRQKTLRVPKELMAADSKPFPGFRDKTPEILAAMKQPSGRKPAVAKPETILACDSIEWLAILEKFPHDRMILSPDKSEAESLVAQRGRGQTAPAGRDKPLYISFPAFVAESDVAFWKNIALALFQNCRAGFVVNNPGHFGLVPEKAETIGGPFLNGINSVARKAIRGSGIAHTMYSLEDDFLNMRNGKDRPGWCVLFCHVPLYISRIDPGFPDDTRLSDQKTGGFFTRTKNGLYFLVGEKPLCLFSRQEKLRQLGIRSHVIDFSFTNPGREYAEKVLGAYEAEEKLPGTSLFNFKQELA